LPVPNIAQRVETVKKHLEFSIKWKGPVTGIFEMRTHYSNYFRGMPDFKQYRVQLVEEKSHEGVNEILNKIIKNFKEEILL